MIASPGVVRRGASAASGGKGPPVRPLDLAAAAAIAVLAGVLLFWGLGKQYLWQDEAATAVLGGRMLRYGKPLGYDGKNLITMDYLTADETEKKEVDKITGSARAAIDYYARRGDFKPDTTWIGHPWGQFLLAGLSLHVLGHGDLEARLPFAAAGWLTVALLYIFVRREFRDPGMAATAALLLSVNSYWILHMRQCRYYALSSLFMLLTFVAWARWRRGGRFGGAIFVAAAWCWFQSDFGSFWPALAVLLALTLWEGWPSWKAPAVVAVALGATVAPWVWYYELAGRYKPAQRDWAWRFLGNFHQINQFVAPLLVLLVVAVLLWRVRTSLEAGPKRILVGGLANVLVMIPWVPSVAPEFFLRYVVHVVPLACILAAWLVARLVARVGRGNEPGRRWSRAVAMAAAIAFLAVSPLPSAPVAWLVPREGIVHHPVGLLVRPGFRYLISSVFGRREDPNRASIEWVAARARPGDEVLVNYEDIPFMFYTDLAVRGGIPCFRVEDRRSGPPRFTVLRPKFPVTYGSPYEREGRRAQWKVEEIPVRSLDWGNNPDPERQPGVKPGDRPPIWAAERADPR